MSLGSPKWPDHLVIVRHGESERRRLTASNAEDAGLLEEHTFKTRRYAHYENKSKAVPMSYPATIRTVFGRLHYFSAIPTCYHFPYRLDMFGNYMVRLGRFEI